MKKTTRDWLGRIALGLVLTLLLLPNASAQAGFFLLGGAMIACVALWFIIAILICVWVYKDAEKRGSSGVLWLIVVLLAGIIGLIIWLLVRPPLQPQYPPPGYPPHPPR